MMSNLNWHTSAFPPANSADAEGLVCLTPHLTVELLLDAYAHGIFPWYDQPVHWYSPDPRAIFLLEYIHLPRNLGKLARKANFTVTFDQNFKEVIDNCASSHQQKNGGTWISPGFRAAYTALHEQGYAHSTEVWQQGKLVGGLYGVQLGQIFIGESMFHLVPNASKVAFAALIARLKEIGIVLIDSQVLNQHTATLGALQISRKRYLMLLTELRDKEALYAGQKWPK